jgi:hypothetical protein
MRLLVANADFMPAMSVHAKNGTTGFAAWAKSARRHRQTLELIEDFHLGPIGTIHVMSQG